MVRFEITANYYRAIAKTAFHYYLQTNESGIRGDEPEFADLRRFIMDGGDPSPFFMQNDSMPPILPQPFGIRRMTDRWLHFLAAEDWRPVIRVFVLLFMGPESDPFLTPHSLILGKVPASKSGTGSWGHGLVWQPGSSGSSALLFRGASDPRELVARRS